MVRTEHTDVLCDQVAARTAHQFNPSVKIYPIHANIKDPEYDVSWFKSFDIVLNALDNIGTYFVTRDALKVLMLHPTPSLIRRAPARQQNVFSRWSTTRRIWHGWVFGTGTTYRQGMSLSLHAIHCYDVLIMASFP